MWITCSTIQQFMRYFFHCWHLSRRMFNDPFRLAQVCPAPVCKPIASMLPLAPSFHVSSYPVCLLVHLSSIFTFVEAMHQMINHSRVFSLASAIFHCHHQRTVWSPLWEWEREGVKGQERWVSSLHLTIAVREAELYRRWQESISPALGFFTGLPSDSPWAVAEPICHQQRSSGTSNSRSGFSQDSAGMCFNHTHSVWPSHTYELLFIDWSIRERERVQGFITFTVSTGTVLVCRRSVMITLQPSSGAFTVSRFRNYTNMAT